MDRKDIVEDKVAFKFNNQGFLFTAIYLLEPKSEALIEIRKDNQIIKEFLFPSYKVGNIQAHVSDIVRGLKEDNDSGLLIAGSDGLGGNAYQEGGENE